MHFKTRTADDTGAGGPEEHISEEDWAMYTVVYEV